MNKIKKLGKTLEAVKTVSEKIKDSKLDAETIKSVARTKEFKRLRKYLNADNGETLMFTAIYVMNYLRRSIELADLVRYFDCQTFDVLAFYNSINSLINKRLIAVDNDRRYGSTSVISDLFVPKNVSKCILNDVPLGSTVVEANYDALQFVAEADELVDSRDRKDETIHDLRGNITDLEESHADISFVTELRTALPDVTARMIFYVLANELVTSTSSNYGVRLSQMLSDIYDRGRDKIDASKEFQSKKHILQKREFVELSTENMFSDVDISLSEKGIEFFLKDDAKVFLKGKKIEQKDLISPEKIVFKELYFDDETETAFNDMKRNFSEENFNILQNGLKDRGLQTGVAAIFYGLPGTGKTEMANQIAKATGRSIMHVDISKMKSCWFGESEKIIKKLFDDYRSACENCELKPILLFNEADAIFSKRKDIGESSVAQTENAIQNIILEELEKLDGILIATTNLIDNLDSAFERRFLFKVRFDKPTEKAKSQIWKSKLSRLTDDECTTLAKAYDFSGGQIDNIVRKVLMKELLNGCTTLNINEIMDICKNEKIGGVDRKTIGFGR